MRAPIFLWWLLALLGGSSGLMPLAGAVEPLLSPEHDRRIEQERLDALRPSEALPPTPRQTTTPPQPATPEMEFFRALLERRVTYHADLAKVIVILLGEESQHPTFEERVLFLREQRLLPVRAAFRPTDPLQRGLAATVVCRALGIRGGILPRLFGLSERYAIKELVHAHIMVAGFPQDLLSGKALTAVFLQSADYRLRRRTRAPKTP